jgi:hypothetical protein
MTSLEEWRKPFEAKHARWSIEFHSALDLLHPIAQLIYQNSGFGIAAYHFTHCLDVLEDLFDCVGC